MNKVNKNRIFKIKKIKDNRNSKMTISSIRKENITNADSVINIQFTSQMILNAWMPNVIAILKKRSLQQNLKMDLKYKLNILHAKIVISSFRYNCWIHKQGYAKNVLKLIFRLWNHLAIILTKMVMDRAAKKAIKVQLKLKSNQQQNQKI